MATDAELHERVRKGVAERERTTEQQGLRGLTRVEIAVEGHSTFRAHSPSEPEFTLTVDEPEERGGRNQGPPPLAYFLTGVGTCLLMQVARLIIARDLDLRVLGMHMRGERERQVGGGFLHIIQEIDAEGSASQAEVQTLAEEAEAFCYVHATLSKAVKITLVVNVNGSEAVRRESDPDTL